MTQQRVITGLLVTVLLGAPRLVVAQIDTSTPQGQIAQEMRDLRVALAADDIDNALKFYWNDPRLVVIDPDDGLKIEGWATLKQYLEDRRTVQKTLIWRTRHRQYRLHGDNAVVTFYVTRQVKMGSTVFQKDERGTYVLKKMNNRWLIVAQHISALPSMRLFQQTK